MTRRAWRPAQRRAWRRVWGAAAALGLVAMLGIVPGGPLGAGVAAAAAPFSKSETITRTDLNADGSETVVDSRNFSVSVSNTQDLRGRQLIQVSWTGAHPTGGLVADHNSQAASREEYPVVLLECRGMDTPAAPAGQQLTPETCWTQTPSERYVDSFNSDFPSWRLDRYATTADRAQDVNQPPASLNCDDGALAEYNVPFTSVDGTTYQIGSQGLCGLPPEGSLFEDPAAPPANTAYGVTGTDGSGTEPFEIWTDQENASLGCSTTVPCALVIVPIMGISCDPTATQLPVADRPPAGEQDAASALCENTGRYAPGQAASTGASPIDNTSVIGALWWAASNWRNRITVPLTFAPPANACDVLDSRLPVDIYGSELFDQAGLAWEQKFCQDPTLFKFQHVSTGEEQARSALSTNSISAALVSRAPDTPFTTPVVNAPVAVTGFAISYAVDDANRRPYTTLKLNARLLAKLLSESYWGMLDLQKDYRALPATDPHAAMANNPQDMTVDPEFVALNPGIGTSFQTLAASTLLALSGNSDVMYALTSYINADPDARAFLDGKPDPWGMTVNPAYKGIKLPIQAWPLEDDFISPDISLNGCLDNDQGQVVPIPILPLMSAPMANLEGIAQAMQFAIANSQLSCSPIVNPGGELVGGTLKPLGRQAPGVRFMLGVTAVGDANLYGLREAALQSSPGTYVTPTNAAMVTAVKTATKDKTTGIWNFSYSKLRGTPAAYPGTMIVYAEVPTKGLDSTTANQLAKFVRYAASTGQTPGQDIGQLPPGYAPMTSGNGMSALVSQANQDADLIAAQSGQTSGSPPSGSSGSGSSHRPAPSRSATPSPSQPATPSASPTPGYTPPLKLPLGYTPVLKSDTAAWALPGAVLMSLIATVIAIIMRTVISVRRTNDLQARARRINGNEGLR